MDLPENSNVTNKWDHPWTTDEMREHRHDWSLAADAGLLKHLQQFSDNLTERVEKTQKKLNSLTSELNEASVIIDNVTNASLALANTQFIESRVYDDDSEIKGTQSMNNQETNNKELDKEDLIACVSESIKQGLIIMDEKFQRLEVLASDSEDEGEIPIPSVVLRPKDPYQNRPLPYIIGSDKWKSSCKIGLESSSSDSEPPDADEDSPSEDDNEIRRDNINNPNNYHESVLRRSSTSSSNESSDRRGNMKNYSDTSSRHEKFEARSQETLNFGSEIATPTVVKSRVDNTSKGVPSFAEELAKRLGNVLPSNKNQVKDNQEADQSSINRSKDDLFAPDDNDVFGAKAENLFSDAENLFDEDVSSSLWKNKPYRPPKTNIIPPSLDIPPPMSTEASNPKSAFDDLYGDADSEDSVDIFAPRDSLKSVSQKSGLDSNDKQEIGKENKLLKIVHDDNAVNMATSTPENDGAVGLFGDENYEDNNDDLFGDSVKSRSRISDRSPELARTTTRNMPPGLSITQADILSSNLGSRLFQRVPRQDSSDSSDTEPSIQNADARANYPNLTVSDSSGVSIRPNSTNNTLGLSMDVPGWFQPDSESTRLKSEDIYRERVPSDSLFEARTRHQDSTNSTDNLSNARANEARIIETLDSNRDENFDNDDVFGPPPLNVKQSNDLKSKLDITTNDDLFSNSSSSGSRSQKSFDLVASNEPQYEVKSKTGRTGGLFDEDDDIFGTGDAPEIDIFGEAFKSSLAPKEAKLSNSKSTKDTSVTSTKSSTDLFTPTIKEQSILSRSNISKSSHKSNSIFDDSEDENDDLFGSNFLKKDKKSASMLKSNDDELFANLPKSTGNGELVETKKDSTNVVVERANKTSVSLTSPDNEKRDTDEPTIESTLPSYPTGGLFDSLDDDADDDDSLFSRNKYEPSIDKRSKEKVEKVINEIADESNIEEKKFQTNYANIEGLLKDQSSRESNEKIIVSRENEPAMMETPVSEKTHETTEEKLENIAEKVSEDQRDENLSVTDGGKISKSRNFGENVGESTTRRDPPKTLSIRLPAPSATEDSAQAPRRAVSGKIKNLMGKMGDLKILSPTDTPPLWRKTEDKSDADDERTGSKDSEDGSSMSAPSQKSPSIITSKKEDINVFPDISEETPSPISPRDDFGNSETAVSFDVPAQVEVLAVTASKSRARIQAKRRPQSRHARQSALRKSGIDFDTVDNSEADAGESNLKDNTFSGLSENIPTVANDSIDVSKPSNDRLGGTGIDTGRLSTDKIVESSSILAPEDKSEMSFSKGSTLSLNKNTLLSPSTDEEDLFDVPPDLPEDPPKEDTLFGRAPILSPIDRILGTKKIRTDEKSREGHSKDSETRKINESTSERAGEKNSSEIHAISSTEKEKTNVDKYGEIATESEKPTDPLHDNSHDPLKDPSQLFAFVTKTPSPEKGQNVLFKEDASLFTHVAKKSAEEAARSAATKKPVLDLFDDDSSGDLFSGQLAKSSKKSTKSTKNLFDDIDTDEEGANDLFGAVGQTKAVRETIDDSINANKMSEKKGRASPSRSSLFDDDVDDDLFVNTRDKKLLPEVEKITIEDSEKKLFAATSKISKDTKIEDIFGDHSSGEEDIFGTRKTIGTGKIGVAGGSIFSTDTNDDDANDIFGQKTSTKSTNVESNENRATTKKNVTRDLKKTAEKIVEDPLSMLQDD